MKILLDMNLSPLWVGFLAEAGIDAVHWSMVGDFKASDAVVMEWARREGRVIFTNDLDFSALLAATRGSGPSVIQFRTTDVMPEVIGKDLVRILRMRAEAIEAGAIVTIDKVGSRVRLLPLRPPGSE